MIRYLKNIWKELGRTIFTGERYKANLRGLAFGSVLIVVLSIVTGYMNLNKGYLREASSHDYHYSDDIFYDQLYI